MNSQTAWYFYYLCIEVTEEFPVGAVSPSIRPLSTSEAPAEALSPTSGMDATFISESLLFDNRHLLPVLPLPAATDILPASVHGAMTARTPFEVVHRQGLNDIAAFQASDSVVNNLFH